MCECGCRVIVPVAVIEECVHHAKTSIGWMYDIKDNLFSYDASYVEEKMGNVFVRGCYYAYQAGQFPRGGKFTNYLDNYCDRDRPLNFMAEAVAASMPPAVAIENPTDLLRDEICEAELQQLEDVIFDDMEWKGGGSGRSEQHSRSLARTDSRLFLTAMHLNPKSAREPSRVLGGDCYIVTSSTRYLRAARKIGLSDVVTVRPRDLFGLLEIVGETFSEAADMVPLFENPFLAHAVEESGADIKRLVDCGIDVRTKSLPRLRQDLDDKFHEQLSFLRSLSELDATDVDDPALDADDGCFNELLKEAVRRGYRLVPEVTGMMEKIVRQQEAISNLTIEKAQIEQTIVQMEGMFDEFSKRKQKYLRRFLRQRKT